MQTQINLSRIGLLEFGATGATRLKQALFSHGLLTGIGATEGATEVLPVLLQANKVMNTTLFEIEPAPLPALLGTPRQIEFASKVRPGKLKHVARLLKDLRTYIEELKAQGRTSEASRQRRVLKEGAVQLEVLRGTVDASFWIDRRDNNAWELMVGAPAKPGNAEFSVEDIL